MGATIAAKALVILALLGAGATGIYAVANKGFGSGKQTEKTDEEVTRADAPTSAKSETATEVGVSAPAGTASGAQGSDKGKVGESAPASAVPGSAGNGGEQRGAQSPSGPSDPENPPQTGGTGGGNGTS